MEEADARREARRLQYVHERPSRVGGAGNYRTAVMQKQKAIKAATSGLEMQVNCFGNQLPMSNQSFKFKFKFNLFHWNALTSSKLQSL